ncbi:hypothetical protein RFI_18682 [Reticulomyxa filosa]|uniref:Uncharacterized protein n=1 Tax=Reticulomyxa filosa TaxID=46433 RepID=X6MX38_RETFI|nr:hypothetical protein RFI_18682 [Reticulomyxa filosa]|eukprot:ETO18583.1 hypothetical protein RFI_18682 [Reticulomyxa filosa]
MNCSGSYYYCCYSIYSSRLENFSSLPSQDERIAFDLGSPEFDAMKTLNDAKKCQVEITQIILKKIKKQNSLENKISYLFLTKPLPARIGLKMKQNDGFYTVVVNTKKINNISCTLFSCVKIFLKFKQSTKDFAMNVLQFQKLAEVKKQLALEDLERERQQAVRSLLEAKDAFKASVPQHLLQTKLIDCLTNEASNTLLMASRLGLFDTAREKFVFILKLIRKYGLSKESSELQTSSFPATPFPSEKK